MSETAVLMPLRLLGLGAVLFLLPGLVLLAALHVKTAWHRRIVLAFALSYSWVFLLSMIIPLLGWTIDAAGWLTGLAILGASAAAWSARESPGRPAPRRAGRTKYLFVAAMILTCAAGAWVMEAPFTGEEGLDLVSVSRFADGGPVTFENTSLVPNARPVYLFQPYQLAIGAIARWSGTDAIVALVKFRALAAPLTLIFLYSVVRRLAPSTAEGVAAFLVLALFVVLDMDTWEWMGAFPFVRRGGIGAGLCFPAMMALCLDATRLAEAGPERRTRTVALITAPFLLAASLATHPLEMFPLLCFAAALVFAILTGLDRQGSRRHATALLLLLVAAAGMYRSVHARAVPYVAEHEAADRRSLRQELGELLEDPVRGLMGGPTEGSNILTRTIPATTAVVYGLPALALVALRGPATAVVLVLATAPLALLYASPAGFALLKLLTSAATVLDVNTYFGFLGLFGLAIGVAVISGIAVRGAAAARTGGLRRVVAVSAIGAPFVWTAWYLARAVLPRGAEAMATDPAWAFRTAGLTALLVTVVAIRRTPLVGPPPMPIAVALASVCLAMPLAMPDDMLGGIFEKRTPLTLVDRLRESRAIPSVENWPAYYERLKTTFAASLDPVPLDAVNALRARVPPRSVVLADPRYSCDLAMLINGYCINPEKIYGHFYRPAAAYLAEYVTESPGAAPEHPFFNAATVLSDAEARLLRDYRIDFILVDDGHRAAIDIKLRQAGIRTEVDYDAGGYRLYRVTR